MKNSTITGSNITRGNCIKKQLILYNFDKILWPFQTGTTGIQEKIEEEVPVC